MQRDETPQRKRVLRGARCRLRLGQELEQGARTGVVVVHGCHDETLPRARDGADEQSQLVVQHAATKIQGVGGLAAIERCEPPRVEEASARAQIRPHAVLHSRDDDGVELGADRPGGSQHPHDALRGRRRQSVLRHVGLQHAPHEGER